MYAGCFYKDNLKYKNKPDRQFATERYMLPKTFIKLLNATAIKGFIKRKTFIHRRFRKEHLYTCVIVQVFVLEFGNVSKEVLTCAVGKDLV